MTTRVTQRLWYDPSNHHTRSPDVLASSMKGFVHVKPTTESSICQQDRGRFPFSPGEGGRRPDEGLPHQEFPSSAAARHLLPGRREKCRSHSQGWSQYPAPPTGRSRGWMYLLEMPGGRARMRIRSDPRPFGGIAVPDYPQAPRPRPAGPGWFGPTPARPRGGRGRPVVAALPRIRRAVVPEAGRRPLSAGGAAAGGRPRARPAPTRPWRRAGGATGRLAARGSAADRRVQPDPDAGVGPGRRGRPGRRDGCFRDLASVHGTYRRVEETRPALELAVAVADGMGRRAVHLAARRRRSPTAAGSPR